MYKLSFFSDSDDTLARATVCKDSDEPGAAPIVESHVKTEEKSPEVESDIMIDMVRLRQRAKQNIIDREEEKAKIQSETKIQRRKTTKMRK